MTAFGAPIEVNNHSFERANYSGNNSWTNDLTDPENPGEPQWQGRDGNNDGDTFIERIGGFVSEGQAHIGVVNNYYVFQDTGVPWEANTRYVLTVGVGNRNATFTHEGNVSLIGLTNDADKVKPDDSTTADELAGDSVLAEASTTFNAYTLDGSQFQDVVVEYVSGDPPPSGTVVVFLGNDSEGDDGNSRAHYDNVRLESFSALDPDNDGLPSDWEEDNGLDPNSAEGDDGADGDPDGDGLTNLEEFELATDPQNADTDDDGLNDGQEVALGADPFDADTDGDTISDGDEVAADPATDPTDSDTDGDDFEDQAEIAFGTSPVDAVSFPSSNGGITLGLNIIGGRVDGTLGASVNGTAGVVPQSNWNNLGDLNRTDLALVDGEGDPVIIRASWTADDTFTIEPDDPPANIDGNDALMAGHIKTRNGVLTQITVRNIPYPWYDVYVYADGEGTDGVSTYTVNGRELVDVLDEDEWPVSDGNGEFVQIENDGDAGNYMVFRQVVGSTLTITAANTGPDFRAPINGIQIHRIEPGDPSLSPSPSQVNFGVFDGNPGPLTTMLRLTSSGASETLDISNATITGSAADLYSFSPAIASSLPAGESQDLEIAFAGTDEVGIHRAVLEIETNDEDIARHEIQLFTQIKHRNALLAHYPMDETEGDVMEDTSGNGFHGRYVVESGGSLTLGADPLTGSGTSLQLSEGEGASYGEVPPDVELPPLPVASFSLWVQQDAADIGTASVFFSRSEGLADPFAVFYEASESPDPVTWQSEASNPTLISEPFMVPGETFHVVYTYSDPDEDGVASVAVYVNGELNAEVDSTTGYNLNKTGPFQIGGTAGMFGLTGRIDDFQIYETVLVPEQIQHLFDNPGERAPDPPEIPILLGYWPFDDQETETADVAGGNPGTVNGGATFVEGHTGAAGDFAIEFDGVDDSVTTMVSLLDEQGIYTISGWINMDGEQPDRTGLFGQNDLVEFGINGVELSAWTGPEGTLAANTDLTSGEWLHIATVSGESQRFLYINGQEVGQGDATPADRGTSDFNFNIGGGGVWDAEGNWFTGQIDDVAVFSVALDPSEIEALASGAKTPLNLREPDNGGGGGDVRPGTIGAVTKSAASVGLSFPAGTTFDVEYSTDLEVWTVIATDVTGDFEDTDAGRVSEAIGFYRGVAP